MRAYELYDPLTGMFPIQILTFEDQTVPEKFQEDVRALLEIAFDDDEDAIEFEPEAHTKILAVDSDDKVVGHLAAYIREVDFETFSESLGMIGNVATFPKIQRWRIAKSLVERARIVPKRRCQSLDFVCL